VWHQKGKPPTGCPVSLRSFGVTVFGTAVFGKADFGIAVCTQTGNGRKWNTVFSTHNLHLHISKYGKFYHTDYTNRIINTEVSEAGAQTYKMDCITFGHKINSKQHHSNLIWKPRHLAVKRFCSKTHAGLEWSWNSESTSQAYQRHKQRIISSQIW